MNLNENISRVKQLMGLLKEEDELTSSDTLGSISSSEKKSDNEDELSGIDPELRKIFYKIQSEFGSPLKIKFGYRSPQQNRAAGGASQSAHLTGKALDIKFDSPNRDGIKKLISLASKHGVLGIGVYRDAEDIHIDIDSSKGKRAWGPSYSSDSIPDWALPEIKKHLKT